MAEKKVAPEVEMGAREINAVYYNSQDGSIKMVKIVVGDENTILPLLPGCTGKAELMSISDTSKYWVLVSEKNDSFLLFRFNAAIRYTDAEEFDLQIAEQIKNLL